MKRVTQEDIKNINILYTQLKTYAAVSRVTGFAPSTVKKYVIFDYKAVDETNIKRFNKPLPEFSTRLFVENDDWGALCEISDEEFLEIKELWKEMEL